MRRTRGVLADKVDHRVIRRVLLRELAHPLRHRRAEKHRLPLLRHVVKDGLHVVLEAHVEHFVGLVKHKVAHAAQVELPADAGVGGMLTACAGQAQMRAAGSRGCMGNSAPAGAVQPKSHNVKHVCAMWASGSGARSAGANAHGRPICLPRPSAERTVMVAAWRAANLSGWLHAPSHADVITM